MSHSGIRRDTDKRDQTGRVTSLSAVLDAEGAHTAIEVAAVHTHQFGRARDVAVRFLKFALNELAMIRLGRFFKGRKAKRSRWWFFLALRRQIGGLDFCAGVH